MPLTRALNVFLDDLQIMPLSRALDNKIDLLRGTTTYSKSLYRFYDCELKELKMQLGDLMRKGLILVYIKCISMGCSSVVSKKQRCDL